MLSNYRDNFKDQIKGCLDTLEKIESNLNKYYEIIKSKVGRFNNSEFVSHRVGEKIEKEPNSVRKLQTVRGALFENSEIVNYLRVDIYPYLSNYSNESKILYNSLYIRIKGDPLTVRSFKTNVDKEREVEYLLLDCRNAFDRIKSISHNSKELIDWINDNLNQLNKLESSLRLEHSMLRNDNDIGRNRGGYEGSEGLETYI